MSPSVREVRAQNTRLARVRAGREAFVLNAERSSIDLAFASPIHTRTRATSLGTKMGHLDPVFRGQALRYQRPVARLCVALHAHQRRPHLGGELGYHRV